MSKRFSAEKEVGLLLQQFGSSSFLQELCAIYLDRIALRINLLNALVCPVVVRSKKARAIFLTFSHIVTTQQRHVRVLKNKVFPSF